MNRPEQIFHQSVATFINAAYPGLLWFHPANSSGNRGPRLGGILKSMGVLAGVPDIVLILPTGLSGFIELKVGKGSLSPAQKSFRDRAKESGALWAEARTLDEVEQTLERWLLPLGWVSKARLAA